MVDHVRRLKAYHFLIDKQFYTASVDSSSQTPPREARPYGELQVHT